MVLAYELNLTEYQEITKPYRKYSLYPNSMYIYLPGIDICRLSVQLNGIYLRILKPAALYKL